MKIYKLKNNYNHFNNNILVINSIIINLFTKGLELMFLTALVHNVAQRIKRINFASNKKF